ncbi:MAG: ADP-ribosylglycohydrolase family protein [Planctomycetota bacterium]
MKPDRFRQFGIPRSAIRAAVLGHAVGDALGVPVEFLRREQLRRRPVTGMRGHGTHRQPAGTWSDDTSLSLCLAESLCGGYNLRDQGQWFRRWWFESEWTPHGEVFDIGVTTRHAISRLERVDDPRLAGPRDVNSNGNGSLMRILPLALYLARCDPAERINASMDASCLTHGHVRSQLACAFYVELAARIINGLSLTAALRDTQVVFTDLIETRFPDERLAFTLPLKPRLADRGDKEISGSGYVIHTLGASLWCCLNSGSYEEAVLRAVNLGEDTDTTGAVTGGLAGLIYGADSIPEHWWCQLSRLADIEDLIQRFSKACEDCWKETT